MKKLLFSLLVLYFLTGCSNNPPTWYTKIYQDTPNSIYATGEGKTKLSAINDALQNAISKIEITISSDFTVYKKLTQKGNKSSISQKIIQKITSNINKTDIYDYKIIKNIYNKKYYVLISIDRIKNARLIYSKNLNKFNTLVSLSKNSDKIYILQNFPSYIKNTDKIISNLYTAYALFPDQKYIQLIKKAESLKNYLKISLKNTAFIVTKDYKHILSDTFSNLNLPIGKGIDASINVKEVKNKIMGYFIDTLYMNVTLKDKTTLSFNLTCAGKSIVGYNLSNSFAVTLCRKKLEEKLKSILQIQP